MLAPSVADTAVAAWEIAYLALPGTVIAVVAWNAGIRRLGAQNAVVFINLVPIVALGIEVVRGHHVSAVESIGVGVAIVALAGNNVWHRRTKAPRADHQTKPAAAAA